MSTLTALHAQTTLGYWVFAFAAPIAECCALTKQHYLIDPPFGALLGWGAFWIHLHL